jgi:hypothetical protein
MNLHSLVAILYVFFTGISICLSVELESVERVRRCFDGKKVVFVGDSLTRYQYLNLVNALYTGSWQTIRPSIVAEKEWADWKSFHLGTNLRFGCNEVCDCYRDIKNVFKENRHYFDSLRNISISMYLWLPMRPIHTLPAPTVANFSLRCSSADEFQRPFREYAPTATSSEANITRFINEIVRPLKPDIFVINQGFWSFDALRTPSAMADLYAASRSASRRPIWKTTTAPRRPRGAVDSSSFVQMVTETGFEIFDAYNVTAPFSDQAEFYWDMLHFHNNIYSHLNSAFSRQLCRNAA